MSDLLCKWPHLCVPSHVLLGRVCLSLCSSFLFLQEFQPSLLTEKVLFPTKGRFWVPGWGWGSVRVSVTFLGKYNSTLNIYHVPRDLSTDSKMTYVVRKGGWLPNCRFSSWTSSVVLVHYWRNPAEVSGWEQWGTEKVGSRCEGFCSASHSRSTQETTLHSQHRWWCALHLRCLLLRLLSLCTQ